MNVQSFHPADFVVITLFGLKYKGRVVRCILESSGWLHDVQYADDRGDLKRGEFMADELSI